MKKLNNIKFITEATKRIENNIDLIQHSDDYNECKKIGNMAIGYIDCMITYLNCMIDLENNDFNDELGDVIDSWLASVYQIMAEKAIETNQSEETISKILSKRDQYGK